MKQPFSIDSTWTYRYCPACDANASRVLFVKENVPYAECVGCKTVFVNPVPPPEVFEALYNEVWADYFKDEAKVKRDFNPERYWREVDAIPASKREGDLLDVGCATGSFLALAQHMGFRSVKGIDISRTSVEVANSILGEDLAVAGDFTESVFGERSFDVVTLWATLEHLPFPNDYLEEAFRVLRSDGYLCLSVPNWSGVNMKILGPKSHMVGIEHVNYFTSKGLKRIMERHGFVDVKVATRGINPFSIARDFGGRHLYPQWGMESLLEEGAYNQRMRGNPVVRVGERVVDTFARLTGLGDLSVVSGRKP